ncbi:hypothetical protein TWF694_006369 [Orbilia ellipsospora]|uniref:cellulase n=1 Tax=Orbilia ellipsospora TaxID=2528407 RepID=A0AAV9XMG7_9PEZI
MKPFVLLAILGLVSLLSSADPITSGVSITSMYYDCCKPGCAWKTAGPDYLLSDIQVCDVNDNIITDGGNLAASYCDGGPATSCTVQQPWAVNDTFSYGYASIFIAGDDSSAWCCTCYELEFLDSSIKGKKMIVQGININYNPDQVNYFSLTVPGQADWANKCAERFGGTFDSFFGINSTTGIPDASDCQIVPESVRPACEWRYSWYQNVSLPNATFSRVQCPRELTVNSGCVRTDDASFVSSSTAGNNAAGNSTKQNFASGTNSISYRLLITFFVASVMIMSAIA